MNKKVELVELEDVKPYTPDSYGYVMKLPELKVYKSHPDAKIFVQGGGDAGIDLYCVEAVIIRPYSEIQARAVGNKPYNIEVAKTGIHVEIPAGFVGIIKERSSIGIGKATTARQMQDPYGGIAVRGGVIDSSYRGEIMIGLQNLTNKIQRFEAGSKIAQLVIVPYLTVMNIAFVDDLDKLSATDRGQSGFGSTGE